MMHVFVYVKFFEYKQDVNKKTNTIEIWTFYNPHRHSMCASRKKKGGGCVVEIIVFAKGSPRLILILFECSCKNELDVNIKKHQQNLDPVGLRTFDHRYSMRRSRIIGEGIGIKCILRGSKTTCIFIISCLNFAMGNIPPPLTLTSL